MSKLSDKLNIVSLHNFHMALLISIDLLILAFINMYLMRLSDYSVSVVFFSSTNSAIGTLLGYFICTVLVTRLSYRALLKISSGVMLLTLLGYLFTFDNLLETYLMIAIVNGIGRGIFWNVINTIRLKELNPKTRTRQFHILIAFEMIASIVFPALGGIIVTQLNYQYLLVIGCVIYFLGILFPLQNTTVSNDVISYYEIKRILARPYVSHYLYLTFGVELLNITRIIVITVLPFLLLKDEFSSGMLASIVALFGAFISLSHRNDSNKKQYRYGLIGALIIGIPSTALLLIWSIPALIIRQVMVKLGLAFYAPVELDFQFRNRALLLSEFITSWTSEMILITEIVFFVARMTGMFMFVFLFFVVKIDQSTVLQILFAMTLPLELGTLYFHKKLNQKLLLGASASA